MDVEELRSKLHPEEEKERQFKEKVQRHSVAIKIILATVAIIAFFVVFAVIQTPEKVVGTPQACFKENVCLDLVIMTTPEELETGLSNYTSWPDDRGMLFLFQKQDIQRMWMKDMDFPIDMFWIDSKGRVVHIEKNAPPCESTLCEIYEPQTLAKYVIETRTGFAKEFNIYDGNKVELRNIPKI